MRDGQLTITSTAVLAGASSQANVAEPPPAPPALTAGPMLAQWQGSYRRAAVMQASLARIGARLGCLAYRLAVRRPEPAVVLRGQSRSASPRRGPALVACWTQRCGCDGGLGVNWVAN